MALVLKSISFNTNGDPSRGSLHCRKNYDTPIPPVAVLKDGAISPVIVLIPGLIGFDGIRIYIEIENTGEEPVNASITAKEILPLNLFGNVTFPGMTFPPHTTLPLQADINHGNIQGFACNTLVLEQKWKWIYSDFVHPDRNITETTQKIYMIASHPMPPWNVQIQPYSYRESDYIWTDLLDICCDACDAYDTAFGRLPATMGEHLEAFTNAHNGDPAFRYDIRRGENFYSIMNGTQRTIKLQKYINDHNSNYYSYLNCMDCATILQILCRACGIEATGVRIAEANNPPYTAVFQTNPVISIGYDNWAVPFGNGFCYHEMTTLDEYRNQNTEIFDACLEIDDGECPSSNPAIGDPPVPKVNAVSCGYLFAETIDDEVDVPVDKPYSGGFYRERLVANGAACWILSDVIVVDGISPTLAWQNGFTAMNYEYFQPMMEKYGLSENPLHRSAAKESVDGLEFEKRLAVFKDSLPLENYGRSRIYQIQWNGKPYRVEITFALDENEAFSIVMNMLLSITHPAMKREGTDGLSFTIEGELLLRVKNNVVVKVACEGKPDDSGLKSLVDHICESL
jgi:hypothetical protein